jgi:hypothetical protein
MYSARPSEKKNQFLINLNATNNFTQSFYLPLPITDFSYASIHSNQFFAVTTSFCGVGYYTDFYNTDSSSQLVPGLIVANDLVKAVITSNQITSLNIKLVIPTQPRQQDTFQGVLVFSNDE